MQPDIVHGSALCRMFNEILFQTGVLPRHLSTDNDPLFFFHRWGANLRVLDIDEIKSVPHVPFSHPFVERLIGTIRRECLDHVLFWNAVDLERKLNDFKSYYNCHRVHTSLRAKTPSVEAGGAPMELARLESYAWEEHCRGLYHLPVAA